MSKLSDTDKEYLRKDQYATTANLESRTSIHSFGTNPQPWHRWVFDQLPLRDAPASVIDLGAGTGLLWSANRERIPRSWTIRVTDFSDAMVQAARSEIGDGSASAFRFDVMDADQLSLPDNSADIVVANHMLYHIAGRDHLLARIRDVLRPNGFLLASTNGLENLREIDDLVEQYAPAVPRDDTATKFGLENGAAQIARHFVTVERRDYEDELRVTNAEAVIQYVCSTPAGKSLGPREIDAMRVTVGRAIRAFGSFTVTKSVGLFIAKS